VYKRQFVRHDDHASIASTSVVFAACLLGFVCSDKRQRLVLALSLLAWLYIETNHTDAFVLKWRITENIHNTYWYRWQGLYSRISQDDALTVMFEQSLDAIKTEYAIPRLPGSVDIYSFDQAYLLASDNKWTPRPVMQSYSAYTSRLAEINEQHLRYDDAPDNVLFTLQPIDERFPSLDDGLSWPALFDNYTVTKLDKNFAYLSKNAVMRSKSNFEPFYKGEKKIGETIAFLNNDPVYAKISLKPTLLGKFLGIIFKQPQLKMRVKLKNGNTKEYRVLATMMESGFVLSPLIQTTKDFVFLATGNHSYIEKNTVDNFEIISPYGGSLFWNATYRLILKTYRGSTTNLPENILLTSMTAFE
ncbi:MAG: hypothetical protein ABL925_15400, partial [Methylococcales bacterium]